MKRLILSTAIILTVVLTATEAQAATPPKVVTNGSSIYVVPADGAPAGTEPTVTWGSNGVVWVSPKVKSYATATSTTPLPSGIQPGKATPFVAATSLICSEWMPSTVSVVMPLVKGYGWLTCTGSALREYRLSARLERYVSSWAFFTYTPSRYGYFGEKVVTRPQHACYNRPGVHYTRQAWKQRQHGWAYMDDGKKWNGPYTPNNNRWFNCVNT